MTDPDTIITAMAKQSEKERAQDEAHYKLRKACEARAVELRDRLIQVMDALGEKHVRYDRRDFPEIDWLLMEIENET